MRQQITDLREQRAALYEQMTAMSAAAEAEGRDLTAEEYTQYGAIEADFDSLTKRADRMEREAGIAPVQQIADARDARDPSRDLERAAFEDRGGSKPERRLATLYRRINLDPRDMAAVEEVRSLAASRDFAELRTGAQRGDFISSALYIATDEYAEAFEEMLRVTSKSDTIPQAVRSVLLHDRHQNIPDAAGARALSLTASAGGYTVPTGFIPTLVESLIEFGAVRSVAHVINTSSGATTQIPTLASEAVAAKIAEAGSYAGTDPAFGQKQLDAYKYGEIVLISDELAEDSEFDIVSEVARLAGRALGTVTGAAYVVGNGSSNPNGVATAASAGVTALAGNVTGVTFDHLTDLVHSIITGYRKRSSTAFLMKDATLGYIRKIKTGLSGDNTTLWRPSREAGMPDTLLGYPALTDPNMAALGASAKSVLFGDFDQYWIRDVGQPDVRVLLERYADTGQVGVRVGMRTDGELADTAAIKAYVNSAT